MEFLGRVQWALFHQIRDMEELPEKSQNCENPLPVKSKMADGDQLFDL